MADLSFDAAPVLMELGAALLSEAGKLASRASASVGYSIDGSASQEAALASLALSGAATEVHLGSIAKSLALIADHLQRQGGV